jgi:hypothetical protein
MAAIEDERTDVFETVADQHPDLRRYQAQTAVLGRDVLLVLLSPSRP